jgi:hypothetical protein
MKAAALRLAVTLGAVIVLIAAVGLGIAYKLGVIH